MMTFNRKGGAGDGRKKSSFTPLSGWLVPKLWVLSVMGLALAVVPLQAQAQDDPPAEGDGAFAPVPARIAVIDIRKILQESKAALNLREQIDDIRRSERDQIVKEEDALGDEQQELNRQRTVLSRDAYEQKLRELEFKAANLNRKLEARKQQIDAAFENSLAVIRSNLVSVVREISQLHSVNIVFAKTQTLFFGSQLDITDESLEMLDKKLSKVDLKVPPPPKS